MSDHPAAPVPEQAVTAAADAIHFWNAGDGLTCRCMPAHPTARYDHDRERAVRALEAAAPAIREAAIGDLRCHRRDSHKLHYDETHALWFADVDDLPGDPCEALAAQVVRVAELERLAADMLSRIAKWETTLAGVDPAPARAIISTNPPPPSDRPEPTP